jgi:hypothetical protein
MRTKDMTGIRYGRLVGVRETGRCTGGQAKWLFRCDCGNEIELPGFGVRAGNTRSCGCFRRDRSIERFTKHGRSKTPEWSVWCGIRKRCTNPAAAEFPYYGGRGIKMCERWNDFANFYVDMGPRPSPKHSIDRIDSNGHYEPSNCRWATKLEQLNNTRRNVFVEFDGKRMTVSQWEAALGVKTGALKLRLRRGWPVQEAFTRPYTNSRKGIKHGARHG